MISRQWRGLAKPSLADSYVKHLRQETFPKLRDIPGFVDASILRRNLDEGVEFLIVTRWKSMEAIRQFTGREADVAVVPEKVREMMIDYDRTVRHYQMLDEEEKKP
jgi:heme-degrading monooxygenase HmoA